MAKLGQVGVHDWRRHEANLSALEERLDEAEEFFNAERTVQSVEEWENLSRVQAGAVLRKVCEAAETVQAWLGDLNMEQRELFDAKSDAWRESDRGDNIGVWIDLMETLSEDSLPSADDAVELVADLDVPTSFPAEVRLADSIDCDNFREFAHAVLELTRSPEE